MGRPFVYGGVLLTPPRVGPGEPCEHPVQEFTSWPTPDEDTLTLVCAACRTTTTAGMTELSRAVDELKLRRPPKVRSILTHPRFEELLRSILPARVEDSTKKCEHDFETWKSPFRGDLCSKCGTWRPPRKGK